MTTTDTTPRIFVTDYASYNEGKQFLAGQWYDLTEYNSANELEDAIKDHYTELEQESDDLELMVTDFENFPREMYSESFDSNQIDNIIKLASMDDEEKEKLTAFMDCFGDDFDQALNNYEDAYQGSFKDDEEFAESMAESMGFEVPNAWPYNCIDWERAARDLMYDYSESNGHYFCSNW